ncbi:MAG: hypothetical protein Q9222_001387 [Ikaeria aurantiellina]
MQRQTLVLKQYSPSRRCLQSRFSTSSLQNAAKKTKALSKAPNSSPKFIAKAPLNSTYKPFTQILAERSDPTLLYQASSHTVYMVGCYSLGLLSLAWAIHAVIQVSTHPPKYFGRVLKGMYYGMCAFAVGIGLSFATRPYRIIQTIQAVPVITSGKRTLYLQLESIRLFPGLKPKTVSVPSTEVMLSQAFFQDRNTGGTSSKVLEARRAQAERLKRVREGNYLLLPFRQLGFLCGNGFRAIKAVFMSNPFIFLRAKGFNGTWKLGKESGWALEDGRALDRVVKSRVTM